MQPIIPAPSKGQPLAANWAAAVTAAANAVVASGLPGTLVRDGAGALGNASMPANQRNRPSSAPYPYKFQRGTVENADCWLVYLSPGSLVIDGAGVDVAATAGLVVAGDPCGAGWYKSGMPVSDGASTAYLSIAFLTSDGSFAGVSIVSAPQSDTSSIKYLSIPLAYLEYDSTLKTATINQNVVGALAVSSSAGGGALEVDDVSVDLRDAYDTTDDGKIQIKDWDHDSPPAAATTLAEDLANTASSGNTDDKIVIRKSNKQLVYKSIGQLKDKYVTIDTAQTITGQKSFTSFVKLVGTDNLRFYDAAGNYLGYISLASDGALHVRTNHGNGVYIPAAGPITAIGQDKLDPDATSNDDTLATTAWVLKHCGGLGTIQYVGDVRYDTTTHWFQKRVDTYDAATGVVMQGTWENMTGGDTTPHQISEA